MARIQKHEAKKRQSNLRKGLALMNRMEIIMSTAEILSTVSFYRRNDLTKNKRCFHKVWKYMDMLHANCSFCPVIEDFVMSVPV